MKYLLIALMMYAMPVMAQEQCDTTCQDIKQDVNTPVPKGLEDAEIIVRTKDGKETKMSANDFKVVKRKQQFKVTERVVTKVYTPTVLPQHIQEAARALREKVVEIHNDRTKRNILAVGLAYDYTNLDMQTQGNKVTLYSQKGPVFDLSYMRRRVFESDFLLGIGINTNGAPRGVVGLEF